MKKLTLLLFAALAALSCFSQQPEPEPINMQAPEIVVPPSFPGGEQALLQFISSNIRYPPLAREHNVQGVVALTFVVEKTGKIDDIQIIKDLPYECGAEAARVVATMPDWQPGRDDNGPVRVRFTLPIRFRLEGDTPKKKGKKRFRDREALFGN